MGQVDEDYPPWFDHLDRYDYFLLGRSDRPQAIVTSMDLLRYLYSVAYPFVLLSEIEGALRRMILTCVSDDELRQIADTLKIKAVVEEMVFNDYAKIIAAEQNWPRFQRIFGGNNTRVKTELDGIRRLRNVVFHFKRELSDADQAALLEHRNWVLRRAKIAGLPTGEKA